jgi:hypothetical protein
VADDDRARPAGDPAALRSGHEQLRERVLAGRPDGWRLGHAVLARRGMAGWIAASAAVAADRRDDSRARLRSDLTASAPASVPGAGQIVAVLSEMDRLISASR